MTGSRSRLGRSLCRFLGESFKEPFSLYIVECPDKSKCNLSAACIGFLYVKRRDDELPRTEGLNWQAENGSGSVALLETGELTARSSGITNLQSRALLAIE